MIAVGGRKLPGALTAADCRFDGVRVTRQAYAVDGWGVGELWRAGGEVLRHESPGDWEPEGEDDELFEEYSRLSKGQEQSRQLLHSMF